MPEPSANNHKGCPKQKENNLPESKMKPLELDPRNSHLHSCVKRFQSFWIFETNLSDKVQIENKELTCGFLDLKIHLAVLDVIAARLRAQQLCGATPNPGDTKLKAEAVVLLQPS